MRGLFTKLRGVETTPLPASTPDITKAQVGGWLQFAASVGIAVGFLQPAEAEVLIGASGLVAFGIHTADAIIRNGRAHAVATLASVGKDLSDGYMGKNAPTGEEIPASPTLAGDDGTGVPVPLDNAPDPDPAEEQPADSSPAVDPGPTPDEIAEAQAVVDEASAAAQKAADEAVRARARLAELQTPRQSPPPGPTRPLSDQAQ